jgi:hypothetical protein
MRRALCMARAEPSQADAGACRTIGLALLTGIRIITAVDHAQHGRGGLQGQWLRGMWGSGETGSREKGDRCERKYARKNGLFHV